MAPSPVISPLRDRLAVAQNLTGAHLPGIPEQAVAEQVRRAQPAERGRGEVTPLEQPDLPGGRYVQDGIVRDGQRAQHRGGRLVANVGPDCHGVGVEVGRARVTGEQRHDPGELRRPVGSLHDLHTLGPVDAPIPQRVVVPLASDRRPAEEGPEVGHARVGGANESREHGFPAHVPDFHRVPVRRYRDRIQTPAQREAGC